MPRTDIPFSVLDLAPVPQGADAATAFRNTRDLAQHAEKWGYARYWLAEHHNLAGIASAATAVVINHVAAATSTIRVGSGGIMLPNHAPLMIAEQFGTLAALHPGRIDLGLGRAPGTDHNTARALRRYFDAAESFPQDVIELRGYFRPAEPNQAVQAVPGAGLDVPIWLLGSSLFSAQLAAMLGLPFAFASHFAPEQLMPALEIYRSRFDPSEDLARPYVMVCTNVFAADTDAEAEYLFTSLQQQFLALQRGRPGKIQPPVADIGSVAAPMELAGLEQAFRYAAVGGPDRVRRRLTAFLNETGADELMATASIYDHTARLRSFEILAGLRDEVNALAKTEAAQ